MCRSLILFFVFSLIAQAVSELLQIIVTEPRSFQVPAGSTVVLDCIVANQYGDVAWCKDGHCTMGRERPLYYIPRYEILGDRKSGNNSLKIENVTLDDDGVYQCQIGRTLEARETVSNYANLTVLIAPNQIATSFVPPGLVISGKQYEIQCEVFNARPPPKFSWKTPQNTQIINITQQNILSDSNSKLFKSISTIKLVADTQQHGQEIVCTASHPAKNETWSSSKIIAVDYQPVVKITLKPTKMIENEEYWFECIAEGRPSITALVWKTNTTILERLSMNTDGKYPLHVKVTRQMHNQFLSCSALNSAGLAEDYLRLSIIYSPVFKSVPSPYTLVSPGDSLILSCEVDSNPPANILWTKNGEFVGGGSFFQIPEVHDDDYGVYGCVATMNGQFSKIFASTKVLPPAAPRFYPPPAVYASKRSEVMLKCQLEGDTEPLSAFWTFQNGTLMNSMKYTVVPPRDVKIFPRYEMALIIHNVENDDFGDYSCHVTNRYGINSARIQLQQRSTHLLIQLGIYLGLLVLLSLILFSSYLCCHHAVQADKKRNTLERFRRVQTWLQSKPSMWIHNLAAAEKMPLTVYDVKSGVTRTTLDPPVDIVECYIPMMNRENHNQLIRPSIPPPPPPIRPFLNFDRIPFCQDDQSEQLYETADPISWHIDC